LLNKAVTAIIFVIAVVVILGYFKIDVTPLIAGVGLGALAIGLALLFSISSIYVSLFFIFVFICISTHHFFLPSNFFLLGVLL